MSNKSELLANEIKQTEIEVLQDRVNNNSKLINDMTNKLVANYNSENEMLLPSLKVLVNDDILSINISADGSIGQMIQTNMPGQCCPLVEPADEVGTGKIIMNGKDVGTYIS